MKSFNNDSDEYDLFSGFADWFDRYGLSKVIEIDGENDSQAIELALQEIDSRDPLTVWVEGRHGFQFLTAPNESRLDRQKLLAKGVDYLVGVWFSEEPFDNDKNFELLTTGDSYLCEFCEDLEDSSDCEACEGEPGEFIEVRLLSWKDDVVEHLSELANRSALDLPSSFWKRGDGDAESAAELSPVKNFCESCGGALGKDAKFCAACGTKV